MKIKNCIIYTIYTPYFLWICFFAISTSVAAQETITLQNAFKLALQNNLQIKQAQFDESLSEENLKQAKMALYPNLVGRSNAGISSGLSIDPVTNNIINMKQLAGNVNLSSNAYLFQGFQRINQISKNKYLLEGNKSMTQKAKNDLILLVLENYLQVLANQDVLLAAKQQLIYNHQQLDREQKFYDVGNKTIADLSQAKAQLAIAELNVTNAQNKLDFSFLTLAQLLERDPALTFNVEKPVINTETMKAPSSSASDIYSTALTIFPEIKQAEYNTLAHQKEISINKGKLYPDLLLQGELSSRYSNAQNRTFFGESAALPFFTQMKNNFGKTLNIGLNIPIFNSLSARSNIRIAKVRYDKAKATEQFAKNNLNKLVNQAVLDARAAEQKYHSSKAAHLASKDAFNAIEKRYNVGLVNSLEYNQAQTNLNKAQFDAIQAEYDLMFRCKTIDFYLGKCLVENGCE